MIVAGSLGNNNQSIKRDILQNVSTESVLGRFVIKQ